MHQAACVFLPSLGNYSTCLSCEPHQVFPWRPALITLCWVKLGSWSPLAPVKPHCLIPGNSSDRWTDLRVRRLVLIPRLYRLPCPLQPSHSKPPCPILFLMPHSLLFPFSIHLQPFFLSSFLNNNSSVFCFVLDSPSTLFIQTPFSFQLISLSLGL